MKYKVNIIETLEKIVEVEASSPDDAVYRVKQLYRNEDIVLYPEDHTDTTIKIYEE